MLEACRSRSADKDFEGRFLTGASRIGGVSVWIHVTDRRIDPMAYELYGLTEDEIRMVYEATK